MSNTNLKKSLYYKKIGYGILAGILLFTCGSKSTHALGESENSKCLPVSQDFMTERQIKIEELREMQANIVALTFDDGPSKDYTEDILDILKEQEVTATFFVLGNRLRSNAAILIRMIEEGHEIGNHGYDHKNFNQIGSEKTKKSVERTADIVEEITGVRPILVRAPYGSAEKNIRRKVPYPFIHWTKDSNDWKSKLSDERVIYNATYNLKDGDIILFHDIHERTLEIIEQVIEEIKNQGFVIVSVGELFEIKEIEPQNGVVYSKILKKK